MVLGGLALRDLVSAHCHYCRAVFDINWRHNHITMNRTCCGQDVGDQPLERTKGAGIAKVYTSIRSEKHGSVYATDGSGIRWI